MALLTNLIGPASWWRRLFPIHTIPLSGNPGRGESSPNRRISSADIRSCIGYWRVVSDAISYDMVIDLYPSMNGFWMSVGGYL